MTDIPIQDIKSIGFLPVKQETLENGIQWIRIPSGGQEVCKLDVLFDSGLSHTKNKLLLSAVIDLLNDGTRKHSAAEIADFIDGYGAFFMGSADMDFSRVSLFSLSKFLPDLLPMLFDMLVIPTFPENEVKNYKTRMLQQFIIQEEKVNVQSKKVLLSQLFNSGYSDKTVRDDFNALTSSILSDFHQTKLVNKIKAIVFSGHYDAFIEAQVKAMISLLPAPDKHADGLLNDIKSGAIFRPKKTEIKNQQASIRLGQVVVLPNHPDYFALRLLTTILGGYFGSRLNKVLREEKGLTYGVHASYVTLKKSAYIDIHTELNVDFKDEAVKVIFELIDELGKNPISDEELRRVIRYIKGNLVQSLDGAFAQSNVLGRSFMLNNDPMLYKEYFTFLNHTDPQKLHDVAKRYFKRKQFTLTVVGD